MSTLFSQRHQGYKAGLILAFVSFIVFLVGFAAPNWTRVTVNVGSEYPRSSVHTGIWQSCRSAGSLGTVCVGLAGHYLSPGWLKAVQALECLALIGFLVLGFYAIIANFIKEHRAFTRIIEIGIGLSAGASLIGVIVYGAEFKKSQSSAEELLSSYSVDIHMSWAFYLTIVGCVKALMSAVVIGVFNKPLPPAATPPVTFNAQPLSGVPVGAPHAPVMVNYPVSAGYVNTAYPPPAGYPAGVPYVAVNPGHPPPYYFVPQGQPGIVASPAQGQVAPPAGATAPYGQAPVVSDHSLPQTKQ